MKAVTASVVPLGDRLGLRAEVGRPPRPRAAGWATTSTPSARPASRSSRSGRWLTTAVARATDHDVVLDGEVIAYDDDGRHTFQIVGHADRDHAFVVFDLLVPRRRGPARPAVERAASAARGVGAPGAAAVGHAGDRRRRGDGGGDAGPALRGPRRQAGVVDVPVGPPRPGVGQGQVPQRAGDGRRRLQARRGQPHRLVRFAARRASTTTPATCSSSAPSAPGSTSARSTT